MRTWIRFAVAPALLAILWTTLPGQCAAQGRGRGGGGGRGGMPAARGAVGRPAVSANRAYVNPGNYSRGYYGGNRYYGGYGYGGYGYGGYGLGYGLAGFGLGYGLGSGLGYGLGGYGGGYYGGNNYYGNSAPMQGYQSFYPPSDNGGIPAYSDNGRGRIEVHVPPTAQVFWNGSPSSLSGPTRFYTTLPLGPAGAPQTFEARWTDANGQVVSQTRTVQAMPNQSVMVDFNQPAVNQ